MINKTTPNIMYSDRIGHKQKSRVTEDKLSINNFHETPLKRESNDISFKGVFSLYKTKNFNVKKNLDLLERSLGRTSRDFYEHFKQEDWADLGKDIKELAGDQIQIRTKNWTKLLMEGIVYPITELPLHLAKGIKEFVTGKKTPVIKRTAEEMANRSFLQKKMDTLNNSDIVNSFSGMMETAEKLKYDSKEVQSAGLFTRAMKQFDQRAGNYNGVHERALTRIVTGFIPAFFLANDAYNLSRLCDDDPQKAKVEHDTRFNQETKRVLSNAYLQLITLGALSKYINSKKWVFMLVTALTVVATESYSRLSNGKKIHFISKEEAIKINQKNNKNKTAENNEAEKTQQKPAEAKTPEKNTKNLNFKGSSIFKGFGMAADMPLVAERSEIPTKATEKQAVSNNEKPLISLEGITKWFATIIIAGFALKYAKKNVKINGQELGKYFSVISKKYDNLYNKLTKEEYKISKAEFDKVISKLSEYNKTIGDKFLEISEKYQITTKIKKEATNIKTILRENGLEELAQEFEHLSNRGKESNFSDIAINKAAKSFFSGRNNKIIEQNLQEFFKLIEEAKLGEEAQNIKNILYENGSLSLKNYTKAKKYVDGSAALKDFRTTFENRFRVDEDKEVINLFERTIEALKAKNPEEAQKLLNMKSEALNSTEYTFGKRNKRGVREAADMITQPFKFIWGTITLPYKHIANRLYKAINPQYELPKWENELDAVYNGIKKLTYKSKLRPNSRARIDFDSKDFKRYMDERINKAFNTSTMSSISNADLSALAKNTSTAATAWFLMCDNHNMVMLKSNGDDKDGAVMKAKERAIQETSRTFWNVLFINLFNDTFRHTFNSSLLGAQAVNTASTLVGENVNRIFIGMPVSKKSKTEILEKEHQNITDEGIKGEFFRFMSRLTGKKALTQREPNQKK